MQLQKEVLEKLQTTFHTERRKKIIETSKIQKFLNKLIEIGEENKQKDFSAELKEVKDNLMENKINFYPIKDSKSLSNALQDFMGSLTDETNVLVEVTEECIVNEIPSHLSTFRLPYYLVHPKTLANGDENTNFHAVSAEDYYVSFENNETFAAFFDRLKNLSRDSTTAISSADFLARDTGTLTIIDKYRYRSILATTPKKHAVMVNIDKIFTFYQIIDLLGALSRLTSNYFDWNTYVISNPSRTGDIEKIIVYGAHGPLKLGVMLVDGGRSQLLAEIFQGYNPYPLALSMEIMFPETNFLANLLGFSGLNPLSVLQQTQEAQQARNAIILLKTMENTLQHFNLEIDSEFLTMLERTETALTKKYAVTEEEQTKLSAESNNFIKQLYKE